MEREANGRWQKGKSANPTGRPKDTEKQKEDKRKAREILLAATPAAARYVAKLVKDVNAPDKVRLQAANTIFDRAYGKPTQMIEADIGADLAVSQADMLIVQKVAKRLEAQAEDE